jgi:hypothetical protein
LASGVNGCFSLLMLLLPFVFSVLLLLLLMLLLLPCVVCPVFFQCQDVFSLSIFFLAAAG